ncbi:MAG: methyltransferase domain-containing protein [Proteobacteria bacterium]|nr:methyltransferase domain-containing protein [Pseudomonadota bacterium]
MVDFARYDVRNYPTLPVREGYEAWAPSYEATVLDLMDLRLAGRLTSIDWAAASPVLDFACGTGRIGQWMRAQGAGPIDGVDLTPAMLARAAERGVYRELKVGDVGATGYPAGAYALVTQSLADEHLASLEPVYAEAARVTRADGRFVLIGFHPFFLMAGVPTHFNAAPGEPTAIESYVHLTSDHVAAAGRAGWRLKEMVEGLVDDAWVAAKPKWEAYRDRPVSFAMVWEKT